MKTYPELSATTIALVAVNQQAVIDASIKPIKNNPRDGKQRDI